MPELADTGRRIKELRVGAGMTQHDLAGSEMSSSYISLVERGKRIPSGRALKILAERLGVGVDEISGTAEQAETTGRVRRLDLVGRLVAARRQWDGGDAAGALSEFRALAEMEPVEAGRTTYSPRRSSPLPKYWARSAAPTRAPRFCCGCWTPRPPRRSPSPGCAL